MSDIPLWSMASDTKMYNYSIKPLPHPVEKRWIEQNSLSGEDRACLNKIHSNLKGGKKHSKYMCALQDFLYNSSIHEDRVEIWHHDLVDKDNLIMAEVGNNGDFSNSVSCFVKRVFRFLHNHSHKIKNAKDWRFYYLNYNRQLIKVEPNEKSYPYLLKSLKEKANEHRKYQNNIEL